MAYSTPRPTAKDLDEFYTSSYFSHTQQDNFGYADYRGMAEFNAKQMWGTLKKYMDLSHLPSKTLLDVGCATGGFLASASKEPGWQCTGVELSEEAVKVAKEEYDLEAYCGDLETPELRGRSFGLITMWHVLEHLIDPLAELERVSKMLQPGGLLFVELPSWSGMGRRLKGSAWKQIKPPEHINYFTPSSLERCVQRAGLKPIQTTTHYPSLTDQAWVGGIRMPIHMTKALLGYAASSVGCGGYLRIVARRDP
ncbi:MAG: class I SAM-dependent methyltransferase [Planctomycetota bacterium]